MRRNPVFHLTRKQLELLAHHEGVSVETLMARFDRLHQKGSGRKPAAKAKAPARKKAARVTANPLMRRNGKLMDVQKFAENYYQSVLNRAMTVDDVYELALTRATAAKLPPGEELNYASAVRHRVKALIKKFPRRGRMDETAHYRSVSNPKKAIHRRRNPGHSLMAEAAERYHDGEFDSMPSALSHVAAERRGE